MLRTFNLPFLVIDLDDRYRGSFGFIRDVSPTEVGFLGSPFLTAFGEQLGIGREIARYGLSAAISVCEQRHFAGRRLAIFPRGHPP
jgi:hypothetical protein